MFLPHLCTIYSVTTSEVKGVAREIPSETYTDIPCMFYKSKRQRTLSDTDLSRATDMSEYEVIIEGNKTNVREWDLIDLTDSTMGTIGRFKIQTLDINHSKRKGRIDNIHFTVSKL